MPERLLWRRKAEWAKLAGSRRSALSSQGAEADIRLSHVVVRVKPDADSQISSRELQGIDTKKRN
jgi:hypothetical protein